MQNTIVNRKLVVVTIPRLGLFMQRLARSYSLLQYIDWDIFMQKYHKPVTVPIHRLGLFMQRYQREPKVGSCSNTQTWVVYADVPE